MNNLTLEKGLLDYGIKTQRQLANILGVPESTVSAWMSVRMTEDQQIEILERVRMAVNEKKG